MNNPRYNPTAIALHWLVALGLSASFALGLYMQDLPLSPTKLQLYSWHKWAGISILLLVIFRLLWRFTHAAPELPSSMPSLIRSIAHMTHWLLYTLMLAIPLSGWLMSSAQGFQVVWFGVLPLPDLVAKNAELGACLKSVHLVLNYTLLVLVLAHISVALKHHFWDKDTILTRMLPVLKQRS